jgi:desampylase
MKSLWLTDEQVETILTHVLAEAPREACGLIAGTGSRAQEITSIPNVAPDPLQHYEMDPQALAKSLMQMSGRGLDLIGFYHSHPSDEPVPSPTDVAQAAYPRTAYLIVGLKNPTKPQLAAWTIDYGQVKRLPLHIGALPPDEESNDSESGELSSAQRFAILTAAVLAFVILIGLSLTLLPPAPIITP